MIKTMKKSLVLAAAVAALAAIAVPSMASAATWSPVGTYHRTLSSPSSITFNVASGPGGTPFGISCSSGPTFASLVRTPASALMDLTTTAAGISCTGTGGLAGVNPTMTMIGLPSWTVDGANPSNVKINLVNIEGTSGGSPIFTVSGTLAGGVWSNLNRSLAFTNGTGLNITFGGGGGTYAATVTASEFIKDTTSPFVSLM